jgi:hypothetical protein
MPRKNGEKKDWQPVSSRIPPDLRLKILTKIGGNADFSTLIRVLLQKYADGKILGVRLEV